MSGYCSWWCGAGTDAASEQGGRRIIPSKLAATGGDILVSKAREGVLPAHLPSSPVPGAGRDLCGCLHLQK